MALNKNSKGTAKIAMLFDSYYKAIIYIYISKNIKKPYLY